MTEGARTRGGVSNTACSSRMRLFDPLTRNVPATSVATDTVSGGYVQRGERRTSFL